MRQRRALRVSLLVGLVGLGAVLGLTLGTQRMVWGFGYNAIFGEPLFEALGARVYDPTLLIKWGRIFFPTHPEFIASCYQRVAFCLLPCILASFGLSAVLGRLKDSRDTVYGDSRWASSEEVRELSLFQGKGVFLGKTAEGRFLRHEGSEHYSVIAPTRSGKGVGIIIPTLYTWPGSAIVYDLKGENWKKTAGRRAEFSQVIYFNPNSCYSAHFNPLLEVRPGLSEVRDVQNIANMIVEPDNLSKSDPHWSRTSASLLTALILHVLYAGRPEEKSLAGITALLSQAGLNLRDTLKDIQTTKHLRDPDTGTPKEPHPGIVGAVQDVFNKCEDDMSSLHSTVMGHLALYRDPLLANCTRDSDFSIESLVSGESKSLYIVVPPADLDRLRPLLRLLASQICRRLTEPEGEQAFSDGKRQRLLLMLDEFPALGRLEIFEHALAYMAGYGIKAMLISQSINQLKQIYGERTSILDNTHVRLFFTPNTIETGDYISRTLGDTTVGYRTGGESGKKGSPFYSNVSQSEHISRRPLMTPREVMELSPNEELLFVGGARPIRCNKITYYNDGAFTPYLKAAPDVSKLRTKAVDSVWFEEGRAEELFESEQERMNSLMAEQQRELIIEPVAEPRGAKYEYDLEDSIL